MSAALALTLLLDAGAAESRLLDPRDLVLVAPEIAAACEAQEPSLPPWGAECVRAVIVLYSLETGNTWSPYPRATHGCGVGQVLPVVPRPRARWATPPCETMRVLGYGLRAMVAIWRLKLERARGDVRRGLGMYNGHPKYKRSYAARGWRLWRRLP